MRHSNQEELAGTVGMKMPCGKSEFQTFIDWSRQAVRGIPVVEASVSVGDNISPQNFGDIYQGTLTHIPVSAGTGLRPGHPGILLDSYLHGRLMGFRDEQVLLIAMSDPVWIFWGSTRLLNIQCTGADNILRIDAQRGSHSYRILLVKTTHLGEFRFSRCRTVR